MLYEPKPGPGLQIHSLIKELYMRSCIDNFLLRWALNFHWIKGTKDHLCFDCHSVKQCECSCLNKLPSAFQECNRRGKGNILQHKKFCAVPVEHVSSCLLQLLWKHLVGEALQNNDLCFAGVFQLWAWLPCQQCSTYQIHSTLCRSYGSTSSWMGRQHRGMEEFSEQNNLGFNVSEFGLGAQTVVIPQQSPSVVQ